MSLDATILAVTHDGSDVVLELGARLGNDDRPSVTGQDRMRIEAPTWVPEPGMDLWGDACHAFVVPPKGESRHYERIGYTRLREAAPLTLTGTR